MSDAKQFHLSIAAQVERDLDDILFYKSKLGAYQTTLDELLAGVYRGLSQLQLYPLSGSSLAEKVEVPTTIRYLLVAEEYLLFYEFDGKTIKVYRVLSYKQDYVGKLGLKEKDS